ncbi:FtsX domain-containing protein [Balamuthia mandrillaris]
MEKTAGNKGVMPGGSGGGGGGSTTTTQLEKPRLHQRKPLLKGSSEGSSSHARATSSVRGKTEQGWKQRLRTKRQKTLRTLRDSIPSRWVLLQFCSQTLKEIRSRKVNYLLGCLSCFLVVMVVALMVSILSNAPIVFLRLAELTEGEMDVKIAVGDWTGFALLNYTLVSSLLENKESTTYHTPRYFSQVAVVPPENCEEGIDPMDLKWKYRGPPDSHCAEDPFIGSCFQQVCGEEALDAHLLLLDSEREKHISLGREWSYPSIKPGHVLLHKNLAKQLKVKNGDIIYMVMELWDFFPGLYEKLMEGLYETDDIYVFSECYFALTVQGIYDDPMGKTEVSKTNTLMMEYKTMLQTVFQQMHPDVPTEIRQRWNQTNLYEYARSIVLNYPPPRRNIYLDNDVEAIRKRAERFASKVAHRIGFDQIDMDMPVLSALNKTKFFSMFLGLILNVVIAILLFLSALLIYSLLMVNVETRTFEMGVMRMIGTTRSGVIQLLLCQAFSYAAPSWVLGLVVAQCLMFVVKVAFEAAAGATVDVQLTWPAILLATALGILVPAIAAIFPIRHALSKNLHDSLDIKRNKVQAVSVSLERSEDASFNWSVVIIGSFMALVGAGIYYVFPLSLLTMNLTFLLNMFFTLLIGMLLGLVMLSLNLQPLIERVLVAVLLCWEKTAIRAVVLKNLVAHRPRNRKTTILYALSLGFIIFIIISYQSTITSFVRMKEQEHGTYLQVSASGLVDDGEEEEVKRINNLYELEKVCSGNSAVTGCSWVTHEWDDAVRGAAGSPTMYTLGLTFHDGQDLKGIAPGFFDVVFPEYLVIHKYRGYPLGMSLSEQLYTVRGSSRAIMGSLYTSKLKLDLDTPFIWKFEYDSDEAAALNLLSTQNLTIMEPLAFLNTCPKFRMSPFPSETHQDALVSYPTYLRRSSGLFWSVEELPMRLFLVQTKKDASGSALDGVVKDLKAAIAGQNGLDIWDYRDVVGPLVTAQTILTYFFGFTTLVAMLIASFSLTSSMYTNIYEQSKEIGVMRAIGIGKWWLRRIYLYEAFILVLASSFLGILIGSAVGYTLVLQRILFSQIPIPFEFPWLILGLVFVASILFSLLSSLGPINAVMRKPIVNILRLF